MFYKSCNLFFYMLVIGLITGCDEKHPEGMPDLVHCEITVTDGGEPLADAILSLAPVQGEWSSGGQTDGNGVVVIQTRGFDGVAVGIYKVSVAKRADSDGPTDEEITNMSFEEGAAAHAARQEASSFIPEHLQVAKFSPIEVAVKADGENIITIEIQDYHDPTQEFFEMSDSHP